MVDFATLFAGAWWTDFGWPLLQIIAGILAITVPLLVSVVFDAGGT